MSDMISFTVKPLEWEAETGRCIGPSYKAVGGNIGYRIFDRLSEGPKRYNLTSLGINPENPSGIIKCYGLLDDAKTAAQTHYDKRIRSSIISHAVGLTVDEAVEQCVENTDFKHLTIAVAHAENPIKTATVVIAAMATVIEADKGPAATSQLFEALAAVSTAKLRGTP